MGILTKEQRNWIIKVTGFDYPEFIKRTTYKFWGLRPRWFVNSSRFKSKLKQSFNENEVIFTYIGKNNGTMLDVGAMFGESSMPFLYKNWTCYAFEPDIDGDKSEHLKEVQKRFSKFHLDNRAVSDKSGVELEFFVSEESKGIASTVKFSDNHQKSHIVKTVALKDFIEEKKIDSVQFLKIDVEGADYQVLKGIDFDTCSPEVILVEFEDRKTKDLPYGKEDMVDLFIANGYTVFASIWEPIVKYGQNHSFSRLQAYPFDIKPDEWGNFIALKNSSEDLLNVLKKLSTDS